MAVNCGPVRNRKVGARLFPDHEERGSLVVELEGSQLEIDATLEKRLYIQSYLYFSSALF